MKIAQRILRYIPRIRLYLAMIAILSILTGVAIVLQSYLFSTIISRVFLGRQLLSQVFSLLIVLLLIMAGRAALLWMGEISANRAALLAKTTLRQRLFAHIMRLGSAYVQGERSGELVNTISDGVESLDAYFRQVLPQLCATVLIPAIVLLTVFLTDSLSGIILLVTLPLLPVFMILIGKQANAATQKRWQALSQLSAHFLDVLQGGTTLKLFGRSHTQQETIRGVSDRFGDLTMAVLRIAFLSALVMEMGATISTAIVAVEIGLRLLYGQMPFAPAFFVLLLAPEFYQPLRALGPQFHASMESAAGAQRIFEILDTPVAQGPAFAQPVPLPAVPHTLQFKNVHYAYPTDNGDKRPALRGVSFRAAMGQKIALVGPSGAGKSTLAQLLLRFIEPDQGEICVDGVPLQTFGVRAWRERVSWQPQRPYLFNTTVAENIRMGRPDASLGEIISAAQQANVHDFIQSLPQGYNTVIGERGARLSGGQGQRLSLARAFLKNAPILILDEPTSALDLQTASQVFQALDRLMQDRLTIIIAHQLDTIRNADLIILLQAGQSVAIGTHEELQRRSALYQELLHTYAAETEVLV